MHPLTQEALKLLEGGGAILNTARQVSRLIREHDLDAAIVGGVAVVAHGHARTTVDVDVFTTDPERLSAVLIEAGFTFDEATREFRQQAPVHLVTTRQTSAPKHVEDRDDLRVVSLADLINMKLRSGSSNPLRAQDIADVIGLMRANNLDGTCTPQIDSDLRAEFRSLLKHLSDERSS